jgi:hypothetical protein
MTSDQVQGWLQILGIVGVIASLLFVGAQLNQAEQIANFEGAGEIASRDVEYFTLLAENSSVMHRGCIGEELSSEDKSKFANLFRAWMLRNYWKWQQDSMREIGAGAQDTVTRVAANLHRYPGMKTLYGKYMIWMENAAENTPEATLLYLNAIEKRLNELATIEPNPDYDSTFCGS